ncbi:MAG: sodium-dependent bicarbonate transport family permease [Ignavibacteria bacterium]|nr:sodium-dependent bicarbonate transport family permease [Ignavibacteria bacterium]
MSLDFILSNLLNPPILFFFLGILAVIVKSDLDIPQPVPKLLSLYLLFSIGFHGGTSLANSGLNQDVILILFAAIFMAMFVPICAFFILRWKFDVYNAAAIAAAYGSVSAVTFITAGSFLKQLQISYSGHLVAGMAIMESPAIVIGLILIRLFTGKFKLRESIFSFAEVIKKSIVNGSVFLLIGSLLIGFISGEKGDEALSPFTDLIFKGVLSFFLLDMGLIATKRISDIKQVGIFSTSFAIIVPLLNAAIGILISFLIGVSKGDAMMFTILCASASYIAVPAAMRYAVPEANPSLYVTMALVITFPMNILLGIPIYYYVINLIWM